MRVTIVQGEHPFAPYFPLEVFASEAAAAERCAEITREFLKEYWEIAHDDEPLIPIPDVTVENWSELVDLYGYDEDFIQDVKWGEWYVGMSNYEVKP